MRAVRFRPENRLDIPDCLTANPDLSGAEYVAVGSPTVCKALLAARNGARKGQPDPVTEGVNLNGRHLQQVEMPKWQNLLHRPNTDRNWSRPSRKVCPGYARRPSPNP